MQGQYISLIRLPCLIILAYAFVLEISLLTTESASGHSLGNQKKKKGKHTIIKTCKLFYSYSSGISFNIFN